MGLFHGSISIVFNQDITVGARIMASAAIFGTAWIGVVIAGAMVASPALVLS